MEKVRVWYDPERDYLEVIFKKKEGYFRETESDQIMEKVDMKGNIIGKESINNIFIKNIEKIIITTSRRCVEHTGDTVKKYPKNKETADHSSYYLTAIAVIDHQLGPDQFSPEKFNDPMVLRLIDKVVLQGDPNLDKVRPAGISEIITKQGKRFKCRIDYPRGHALNPMTDGEIVDKFRGMAKKHMGDKQMTEIIETVFELDKLSDIGKLTRLMVFNLNE